MACSKDSIREGLASKVVLGDTRGADVLLVGLSPICRSNPLHQDLEERERTELSIGVIEIVIRARFEDRDPARKQLVDEHREA